MPFIQKTAINLCRAVTYEIFGIVRSGLPLMVLSIGLIADAVFFSKSAVGQTADEAPAVFEATELKVSGSPDEAVIVQPSAAPAQVYSVPAVPGAVMPPGTVMPPGMPPAGNVIPTDPNAAASMGNAPMPGTTGGSVKRPPAKEFIPLPIDQQIRKNPEGLVSFNLVGQPWDVVMQWLADASALSLDWQELPGDSLNLTTTREYRLPEARDLINRHLLARGYTMVLNGEVLSVIKTNQLNPSLVPRVRPEELETLPDHTMCKISFDLKWLIADEAVEELKPMLSSAGQIHKLSRTNRLEVVDTAASLRDIWAVLEEEQSDDGTEQLVRAFHLKHRRAEEVLRMLRDLLGLKDNSPAEAATSGDPNMMQQQMMQMQQQMQQQMQMAASQPGGASPNARKAVETRLVLNHRENMLLVQAAPDQMAVIEQAVLQVDVPADASGAMIQNMSRMKIYRFETVDPQTVHDLLQQLGDLDPGTVLKVDKKNRAMIAWASLADHLTITTLVDRLDQSARSFEVITLRRLDAEYVAGTIRGLMAPPAEEKQNQQNPFGYITFGLPTPTPETPPDRGFRIDADLENNRLLVFANPVEMDEIRQLLMKLGELPDPNAPESGIRVFELNPAEDLPNLQKRLEQLWNRRNPLEFNLPETRPSELNESSDKDRVQLKDNTEVQTLNRGREKSAEPARFEDLLQATSLNSSSPVVTSASAAADETPVVEEPSLPPISNPNRNLAPPVQLSVTADGRLIVTSEDPEALQQAEELLAELSRSKRNYRVFRLKYATPSWIAITLRDYFKAEEQTEDSMVFDPFFGAMPSKKKVRGNHSLSRRRQPQFISDNFTSTILVRDADPRQLEVIEELIRLYDVPEPADTRSMRMTTMFRLKNAKAASVAAAIKDVFRDLLSSNDKALQGGDKNGRPSAGGGFMTFMPGGTSEDSTDSEDEPIRFKGLLSIGVDESSNTLIISSTASLMDTISEMVDELDESATSSSVVQIIKMDPTVDLGLIEEKLNQLIGPQPAAKPEPGKFPVAGQPGFPGAPGAEMPIQQGDAPVIVE